MALQLENAIRNKTIENDESGANWTCSAVIRSDLTCVFLIFVVLLARRETTARSKFSETYQAIFIRSVKNFQRTIKKKKRPAYEFVYATCKQA